jgi:hypothetical protein
LPARIYINGRFLQQPVTGVQRYARELLKAWDALLESGEIDRRSVEFNVLAPRGPIAAPKLRHISLRQVGRLSGHFWDQLELPFQARDGLLFSPGNVHPLLSPIPWPRRGYRPRSCLSAEPESIHRGFPVDVRSTGSGVMSWTSEK